jgi:seryl-tRNA synthetase
MAKITIAEEEFLKLEQKIEKMLDLVEALKHENQRLQTEIARLSAEKSAVIERINLMLDKIDELL